MANSKTIPDRRKKDMCRLDRRTQLFLKYWPCVMAISYFGVGLFPNATFSHPLLNYYYRFTALAVACLGITAGIFWKKATIRNIMSAIAIARTVGVIFFLFAEDPPLSYQDIVRLLAAGIIGIFIFLIAVVETPYLYYLRKTLEK